MLLFEGIENRELACEEAWLKARTETPTKAEAIIWHREGRFCTLTAAFLRDSGPTVTSSSRAPAGG